VDRGPLACTDAERRAALALLRRLRRARRSPRIEARWVRPGWPAWQALCAVARVAGADGTLLGLAQLVPAAVALVAAGSLADAVVAPAAEADTAAADAAVAVARDAPWAEVVFVGAGELGLRARLRAERRAPESTVLLWLEPAPRAWWSSAHPTLAAIAAETGIPRRRGRAVPSGERPAVAIGGPRGQLRELTAAVVAGIDGRLRQPSSASSTK
jgi:hypothetical protein